MSLGEIFRTALIDTALGMGTVFLILMFISLCIWIMGQLCREKKTETELSAAAPETGIVQDDGIAPELAAVITAAVHQYMTDENGEDEDQDYIVRNIRRATWKHTS